MAKSVIGTGTTANDGTGDTLRAAGIKINDNFTEIYTALGDGTTIGLTSTAAELNILDGVTADATEINVLDGITATTAELNYVDGVTSAIQTQIDAKATGDQTVSTTSSPSFANVALTGTASDPKISAVADADLTIVTLTGATPNNFVFGADASLTFPAAASIYESVGDFTFQAASNGVDSFGAVVIQTEDSSGNYTTTFASSGAVRFSNIIKLEPLDAAPTADAGSFAVADGTTWDPATKSGSLPYPVFYDGSSWNALY